MSLKVWIRAFIDIYKNCYQNRGKMLFLMILFIIVSCVFGTYVLFTFYQGSWAWYWFGVMLFGLLLAFPGMIYMIDPNHIKTVQNKSP